MVSHTNTLSFIGVNTEPVDVQVHIGSGLPAFSIVGLANKAVAESKERIRSAFISIGLSLPTKRITVNLAPANLNKEGSHFDLPIALGLLGEMEIIPQEELMEYLILGELALDASIAGVKGVLPAAISANAVEKGIICPQQNYTEASWSGNQNILSAKNMLEIINHFTGKQLISNAEAATKVIEITYPDLIDVKGQEIAKRALEVAAAGKHNMLMVGPPGSGKSMLAKRLPGIMPEMSKKEILDASIIASIAGELKDDGLIKNRPFRDPHCSSSVPAIVGGGKTANPGEITLAHLGVLFLDELPEFQKNVLEALRQPLENGNITIARANHHITYPAKFQLIAAMNPCKCGYFETARISCHKVPKCAQDYQSKISGPLYDRFDIQVDVPEVNAFQINNAKQEENSETIAIRVKKARELQLKRYKNLNITTNSELEGELLNDMIMLDYKSEKILKEATDKFKLSMRAFYKVLKVARSIADLEENDNVTHMHISEALSYRMHKFSFY